MSDSLWPQGPWPARLLCSWGSPDRNSGEGCYALLQGIFPTQGSNPGLPHCRRILYQLTYQGSPRMVYMHCKKVGSWVIQYKFIKFLVCTNLDCKEIQPVHSKGDQPWVFFGRNDAKAETPVLWPPHVKSWLIGKDSDAARDWGQEEKRTTEDEMAGWHHRLDGREFEWTLGVGDGQGGLACYSSWGRRVGHDWATELNWIYQVYTPGRI